MNSNREWSKWKLIIQRAHRLMKWVVTCKQKIAYFIWQIWNNLLVPFFPGNLFTSKFVVIVGCRRFLDVRPTGWRPERDSIIDATARLVQVGRGGCRSPERGRSEQGCGTCWSVTNVIWAYDDGYCPGASTFRSGRRTLFLDLFSEGLLGGAFITRVQEVNAPRGASFFQVVFFDGVDGFWRV